MADCGFKLWHCSLPPGVPVRSWCGSGDCSGVWLHDGPGCGLSTALETIYLPATTGWSSATSIKNWERWPGTGCGCSGSPLTLWNLVKRSALYRELGAIWDTDRVWLSLIWLLCRCHEGYSRIRTSVSPDSRELTCGEYTVQYSSYVCLFTVWFRIVMR